MVERRKREDRRKRVDMRKRVGRKMVLPICGDILGVLKSGQV
jgi:hypothetical protein